MKKLLVALVVIVVLVVGGVAALPFLIDVNSYKPQIEAQAKEALGRDLKLNGPIKLTLWPNIGLETTDVRLANAAGGQAKEMATLKSLVVSVKLMPLLSKSLEIDSFVLNEPVINLEVDKAGKDNWTIGQAGGKPAASGGGAPQGSIKLGDVRLVNGKISYANQQTGDKYQLDDVNAQVKLPSMESPLAVNGSAVFNKEKIDLTLNTGPLAKLLGGDKSTVTAKVASKHLNVDFNGDVTKKQTVTAAGTVGVSTPSIKDLAAWAGNPIKDVKPDTMGKFSVQGKLAMTDKKFDFNDAKIAVDAINATGALSVNNANAAKPVITGKLDVDKLDLNPYLGPEQPAGQPAAAPAGGAQQDWSDAPIDLSALKGFDADLALSAGEITVRKIKTGKATLNLAVKGGVATIAAAIPKPGLYEGGADLTVVANANSSAYEIKTKMSDVNAESYLKAANDMDKLSGRLANELAVTGRGASQKQIVSSLGGNGSFKFTDGAIKGIDLAGIARQLEEVGKGGVTLDPTKMIGGFKNLFGGGGASEKTDFAELGATYTIANGIITNKDLALKSPFVRVTGEGTIAMPPKTMDYKVNIAAVATAQGQGGAQQGGVGIPVNCKGTWAAPNCAPDIAGMFMGDPTKLIKGLGGALGGITGGAGGALPGVGSIPGLGGGSGGGLPGMGSIPGLGGATGGGAAAPAAGGTAAPAAPATGGGLPGGLQNLLKKP